MKLSLVFMLFSILPAVSAGRLLIDSDGTLRNEKHEPQFLTGVVMSHQTTAEITRFGKKFRGCYPEEYRWIYETLPTVEYWKKLGFNSVISMNDRYALRIFFPDYEQNRSMDPYTHYDRGIRTLGLKKSRLHWSSEPVEQLKTLLRSYRDFPFFADCYQPTGGYRPDLDKLFPPEVLTKRRITSHPRDIPFQLGSPEGRDRLFRLYTCMVKSYTELGVSPLAYRMITENRYRDYSDGNRKRFEERLRKKFGTPEAMNAAWNTRYASFGDAAKLSESKQYYSVPAEVEFSKMEQEQAASAFAELHKLVKQLDPGSYGIAVQNLGRHMYRDITCNFNLYLMNQPLQVVSSGTGNYTFNNLENVSDETPFGDAPSVSEELKESLIREAFYRTLARNKLLVNLEAYGAGARVSAQSFHSVLWRELATGHAAVEFHGWGGLREDPANKNPTSFKLLNPNAAPPESFAGVRAMRKEAEPLLDFFAVRGNRPRAEIAFLFSYPTVLLDHAMRQRNTAFLTELAVPLTFQHYAYDAVFEEAIPQTDLSRYRILFAAGVAGTYDATLPALEKFVKEGGTLVLSGAAMDRNEYGVPIRNPLSDGITFRNRANGKLGLVKPLGIVAKDSRSLKLSPPWKSLAEVNGSPILAVRDYGRGRVYAFSGEMQDYARAVLLKEVLAPVAKLALVRAVDRDEEVPNIEIIKARSGSLTAWYINNVNSTAKQIRLSAPELAGMAVVDPIARERYAVEAGSVLLKVDSARCLILVTGPEADLRRRFGEMPAVSPAEISRRYEAEMERLRKAGRNIRPSLHVSIENFANAGFDNAQKWETDTAWKEDGKRDLVQLPFHENPFGDLRFEIIRFDYNENRSCIALKSKNSPEYPAAVKNIPLTGRFASVAFLLGGTHVRPGETALEIRFHFEDGSSITVPVVAGKDFGSWMLEKNSEELNRNCVWKNRDNRGLFVFEWFNPEAAKPLASIDLISRSGETTPIICAITALPSVYRKSYRHRIELSEAMPRTERPERMQWDGDILRSKTNFVWIFTPKGKTLPLTERQWKNAVVRFSIAMEPNEYGVRLAFDRMGMGPRGLRNGRAMQPSPKSWTFTDNTLSPFIRGKGSTGKWVEAEIPLYNASCTGEGIEPLEELTSLMFSSFIKAPIKLRFLRIEYDD